MLYTGKLGFGFQVMDFFGAQCTYGHSVLPNIPERSVPMPTSFLKYFVHKASILYGDEFMVYNREYEGLDHCSEFQFEGYFYGPKQLVRSAKSPYQSGG